MPDRQYAFDDTVAVTTMLGRARARRCRVVRGATAMRRIGPAFTRIQEHAQVYKRITRGEIIILFPVGSLV